ncbi:U-box domain-containing protein kinase family protein [Rhynchospora pubera]|uniref:RING-type E3 ubiquitin transferase n=1 Tax=Rhynchospora pubera TaxID=906938 RepID=A0AAV8CYQ9_9POAL|nr:U-box domain-containing protein kinase family protein [Rhynchospora pubera]
MNTGFWSKCWTPTRTMREREEEVVAAQPSGKEEKVHVAVSDNINEAKSTLIWVMQNFHRNTKIILTHVHVPTQAIPRKQGRAYQHLERARIEDRLNWYIQEYSKHDVTAEKLVIEMNNISEGILQLISIHGVTTLVMGAAADRHYSKKMKRPKSKKAIRVMEKADSFCKIWFVCKGALICTREGSGIIPSPNSMPGSIPSALVRISTLLAQSSMPANLQCSNKFTGPTRLDNFNRPQAADLIYPLKGISKDDPSNLENTVLRTAYDDLAINTWSRNDANEAMVHSAYGESEDGSQLLTLGTHHPDGLRMDDDIYEKFKEALNKVEAAKTEALEDSNKRKKAEMDLLSALQKVREINTFYRNESKQRQGVEEKLIQERQENNHLRSQIDDICNKLQEAEKRKIENEQRNIELEQVTKKLEDKLLDVEHLIESLKVENHNLQCERDDAVNKLEENKQAQQKMFVHNDLSINEFSYDELITATRWFAEEQKIGESSSGIVYKGFLRNTPVAVKVLHWNGMKGISEFHREVAVLSRIRHPNLVTLIGTCPEIQALVYEYLQNGSLEDYLACSKNTLPLPWQTRTRIIGEICSALMFLRSNQPHPVVHGDLKPENILLDANLVSKISNFGMSETLVQSNEGTSSEFSTTNPKGNLFYMSAELISNGDVTTKSDVYSLGIIILRLLTGWQPLNISKRVEKEIQNGNLHSVIDPSAGDWPFIQVSQLAHLGLKCTELSGMKLVDLSNDVWQVIKPMMQVAASSVCPLSFDSASDDQQVPSYFICPIFQEIMRDPHIAADGFTYEAEAIRGWLNSGHHTSPMTNLKLANHELIPNRALRSAILEWVPQGPHLNQ